MKRNSKNNFGTGEKLRYDKRISVNLNTSMLEDLNSVAFAKRIRKSDVIRTYISSCLKNDLKYIEDNIESIERREEVLSRVRELEEKRKNSGGRRWEDSY